MKAQFHPYIVDSDERRFYFIGMAVFSYIAQRFLSNMLFPYLLEKIPLKLPFVHIPTDFTVVLSYGACLGTTYFLFNAFIWKFSLLQNLNIVKTPNLNGCWEGKGKSINGGNSVEFEIELDISQSWTHISITADGKDSESWSTSSHMFISNTQKKSLTYTYINEPKAHSPQTMSMHEGTITFLVKEKGLVLDGTYYTGRGRQTLGSITLEKKLV